MRWRMLAGIAGCTLLVHGQDPQVAKPPLPGSIAGRVTVAGTGVPLEGAEVSVYSNTPKQVEAVTDSQGRYRLSGVEPGTLRVTARSPASNGRIGFGPYLTRSVTLQPEQDLESFDFRLVLDGQIAGKVVDQNKEPVVGARVYLVSREYVGGTLRAVFTSGAQTDDQGQYLLERVRPGRAYLVLAQRLPGRLEAVSNAPAEIRMRLPAVTPTYFPNARSMDGAERVIVRPGERKDNVDIALVRTPSYCVAGVVDGGNGPGELSFGIGNVQPASGIHEGGGYYSAVPGARVGSDGKYRVCDLHPGEYEMFATQWSRDTQGRTPAFAATIVNVIDRDLEGVRLTAQPRIPLAGEVVWDGLGPTSPPNTKIRLSLAAFTRTQRGNVEAAIPGPFEFDGGMLIDDYRLQISNLPKDAYLKDVTYGDRSILYEPVRVGRVAGGIGMRVVLARDGGTVNARVLDKEGKPLPERTVVVLPVSASAEGVFAAAMVTGKTDLNGAWSSTMLAPARYYVLATEDSINKSFEMIAALWAMRSRLQQVTVPAGGTAAVTLETRLPIPAVERLWCDRGRRRLHLHHAGIGAVAGGEPSSVEIGD